MSNITTDLQKLTADYKSYLENQLRECESGRFIISSVVDGERVDHTPAQIAQLKRIIAEHGRLLGESDQQAPKTSAPPAGSGSV